MTPEQITELAKAVALAVAEVLNRQNQTTAQKSEQPSALLKSEKDLFEQGRTLMRRFQKRGGAA